jgi:hypothetical protein
VDTVLRHLKLYGNLNLIGALSLGRVSGPVTIRGVEYASFVEAASVLNVTRSTIYTARKRGTLDKVGLGSGGHNKGKKKPEDT